MGNRRTKALVWPVRSGSLAWESQSVIFAMPHPRGAHEGLSIARGTRSRWVRLCCLDLETILSPPTVPRFPRSEVAGISETPPPRRQDCAE